MLRIKTKKIDYQNTLRDITKSMVRLKRPERLIKMITRFLDREFGLLHTSFLILEENRKHFIFADSKGSHRLPIRLLKLEMDHPLVAWFQNHGRNNRKDFLYRPQLMVKTKSPELILVEKNMRDLKVELVIPGYHKENLNGLLLLGEKINRRLFTSSEISFFQILTQDCSMAIQSAQFQQSLLEQNQKLAGHIKEIERLRSKEQETYRQIMQSLAQNVYAKDAYTFGHVNYVERLGMLLAKEMGIDLSGRKKDVLSAALILHDVGKIGIPDHILNKPDRLNPEEWEIMKTHVEKGVRILEPIAAFKEVAEIVHCHHEHFNGKGYPRGLKGDQIPLAARIVSVVDAFHAIVSNRCYDAPRPAETAFQELERGAGTQFDPQVVEVFIRTMKKDMERRGIQEVLPALN